MPWLKSYIGNCEIKGYLWIHSFALAVVVVLGRCIVVIIEVARSKTEIVAMLIIFYSLISSQIRHDIDILTMAYEELGL